ncbi:hypothetical protein THAPSDRAFT_260749, partial [Thalassiosira pseudonana CCMP1335]
ILILDEHLHRFPFESMPMFANKAVTRMPSLPFVLATLLETKSLHSNSIPLVDPSRLKYVLDPEKNLSETASTLGPALNSLACKNGWEWEGVISEMPSPEFMSQTLREENGLFLYCGHGGGENAFSRTQVEQLTRNDLESGCRSGFSSAELHRGCRSSGIALSYIFAGAPCVVGNLWDVTDRDIDRYCLTLMEDFFNPSNDGSSPRSSPFLSKCVADARRACKLRYIVGSAPVCYGIPVRCQSPQR